MPRIVRSILTYQNNLNAFSNNSDLILQNNQNKASFYTLGIKTQQNNKMSMTHSYSSPTNYLPDPVSYTDEYNYDSAKYHANAKYGASKYICTLQSGKMHKLIRNNS